MTASFFTFADSEEAGFKSLLQSLFVYCDQINFFIFYFTNKREGIIIIDIRQYMTTSADIYTR